MPTALRQLRGTHRPDRANRAEPAAVPVKSLAAPTWLDDEGRKVWRRLARELDAMRVLSEGDLPLLALLADAWSQYLRARAFLSEHGEVYTLRDADGNPRTVMPFPQVAIRNQALQAITRLSGEFGLSPSSRTRVAMRAESAPSDDDALDAFLSRRPA